MAPVKEYFMLDGQKIKEIVEESIEVVLLDVVDSTNSLAKRRAGELAAVCDLAPRLFVAREQSAGRGRMGRRFSSRAGAGIFMSILYFTDKPLVDAVSVTTAAAAVVAEEIERLTGESMKIKWVNDIYSDKGKVCGILAETVTVQNSDGGESTFAILEMLSWLDNEEAGGKCIGELLDLGFDPALLPKGK